MMLPPAHVLSMSGIGFVAAFGLWKAKVGPMVQRLRSPTRASGNA